MKSKPKPKKRTAKREIVGLGDLSTTGRVRRTFTNGHPRKGLMYECSDRTIVVCTKDGHENTIHGAFSGVAVAPIGSIGQYSERWGFGHYRPLINQYYANLEVNKPKKKRKWFLF